MAGSETPISVSSQALVRLGDKPISAYAETFGGITCQNVYPFIRRRILVAYPWRITMVKSKLLNQVGGVGGTPNSEYNNAYQLPAQMFHGPRTVFNSTASDTSNKNPFKDYEIFQDQLLTDATYIKIDYQIDVDEKDMPHFLIEMLVLALKAAIAFTVTDQQNVKDESMIEAYGNPGENGRGGYFREATRLDAQTRPPSRVKSFPLTAVRGS
uniref:Uncharacterized protein n=1 Tax=uncultured marine virus TaxID=186617 RepID=A0A0F7L7E9_9VIRU|nr:conserved hypothetical protein [uncultured marine virus]